MADLAITEENVVPVSKLSKLEENESAAPGNIRPYPLKTVRDQVSLPLILCLTNHS